MSFSRDILPIFSTDMTTVLPIEKVLFMDIETAPLYRCLEEVPAPLQSHWQEKYDSRRPAPYQQLSQEEYFQERSGIHALFSRVVCISLGFFAQREGEVLWRQITLAELDERTLLRKFAVLWEKVGAFMRETAPRDSRISYAVCGHNLLSFDIPFLGRRFILLKMDMPTFWREAQRLPTWQLTNPTVIDTMQLWNFTTWDKSYLSLEMLAYVVGLDFQKALSHTEIRERFWEWEATHNPSVFEPVKAYCEEDVRTTARIYAHLQLSESERTIYLEALNYPSSAA